MKLIVVRRTEETPGAGWGHRRPRFQTNIMFIPTEETENREDRIFASEKEASLFLCPEQDVDMLVKYLAEENPGMTVEVYQLEQSAVCPAAPLVVKKVTSDGVLPS